MFKKRPKIVVLGGGTGTDEFGILPLGDVRRALLALSNLPLEKLKLPKTSPSDYGFSRPLTLDKINGR